jgi:hypothetical protein
MSKPKARRMVIAGAATLGCCLASSVAKAMEDKCEAEGVATRGALPRLRGR